MFMYKLLLLHDIIAIMHFMQFYECVEFLYKSRVLIQIKSFDFRNEASYLGNASIKVMMEFSKNTLCSMKAMEFIKIVTGLLLVNLFEIIT